MAAPAEEVMTWERDVFPNPGKVRPEDVKTVAKGPPTTKYFEVSFVSKDVGITPHLIYFECVSQALMTMRGRASMCLRCKCVGHVRSSCP
ncbi:uncharacterized protein LOC128244117 [Mya arenaria]|uniref:uncharacterized protein LOC128244117 n=1 Tax=Mya arenaria TaxID=6604 RepID=UPI0022E15064|nr:uncharacterized protein LOC128244117 [Mya arenaria]